MRQWSKKRRPNLSDDLDILLGDFTVIWGFNNRLSGCDFVSAGTELTAVDFARAILRAEGKNPDHEVSELRSIRDAFVRRYGNAVSPESYSPWDLTN